MADRIAAERGKSVLQISETPPDWRTPEEEGRLQQWARQAEAFLARCAEEDAEFERNWWVGPAITLAFVVVFGGYLAWITW